ncbi:MAG: hypothetical protein MRY83_00315 [Flavobacteriales bacterium]|nr:hypothetical protein [Flavobacteriales bacterium]
MKRIILLGTLVTMGLFSNAQKCKYDIDKTDQFSKESVKAINTILWGNKALNYLAATIYCTDSKYELEVGVVFQGDQNEYMEIDDVMQLALENGESLTLTPEKKIAPKSVVGSGQVYSIYVPKFKISRDDLLKLSQSRVTGWRVNLDKNYDFDFTKRYKKNCEKFMESTNCMLDLTPAN